jgi:diacylglycerol O-acyltransferase
VRPVRCRSVGAMERAIPLRPEDRAILDLEGPTIAGHTCKVIVVADGDPDVDALRAEIASRIVAVPQLTWRLSGSDRNPAWIPDSGFDPASHVTASPVPAPLDGPELRVEIARLFEQRLDRRRPLWHLDVIPLQSGFALAWRIHHALADGATAMRFARRVLWDEAGDGARPAGARHATADVHRPGHLTGVALASSCARERVPRSTDASVHAARSRLRALRSGRSTTPPGRCAARR